MRAETATRPARRRSSARAASCDGSDRGFAAITGSTGWMRPRPVTPTRRCGRGGTYPEQVIRFAKGHGTQNDFVVLGDLDAALTLTPAVVSALCDRRRGLGADGVLRVTTAGAALAAGVFDRVPDGVSADDWYMDYRNADGSIAQMCGNGVRGFAHYLRASGLETRDEFVVGSLAGPRPVVLHHVDATCADVTVDMGKANLLGPGQAAVDGHTFRGWGVASATHIWPASTLSSHNRRWR